MGTSGRRRLAIVGGVVALLLVGWLLRYTLFLDFPAYVDELQAERVEALMAATSETLDQIMSGELDDDSPSPLDEPLSPRPSRALTLDC